jgi:hypothetical protein
LQGIQGAQGPAGLKGDPGPQGLKGDTGPQGQQGVQGLKGDPGDPATDNQTLSFDGTNLSISVGNAGEKQTLSLSTLNPYHSLTVSGNTLSITGGSSVELPNQIQDLQWVTDNKLKLTNNISATEIDFTRYLDDKQQLNFNSADSTLSLTNGGVPIDLSIFNQSLSFNSTNNKLSISGSPRTVDLSSLENDADADPLNEIQTLAFTPADNKLYISSVTAPVDLTDLKNDADANPLNEIQDLSLTANKLKITNNASATEVNLAPYLDNTDSQTLSYDSEANSLTLTGSGTVYLGSIVAFRATKDASETKSTFMSDYDFIASTEEYDDGNNYTTSNGQFNAIVAGIYTFNVGYNATGTGDSRSLKIFLNGSLYEVLNSGINSGTMINRQITMKLAPSDKVKVVINVGTGFETGKGSFSGYRVY